ncbi:ATP-binding protein [Mycobacterium rhizamassiliense]|uniref:ATP-binding protein n=1 Tax=Mycobacterium rhizamassiliense TaxID=1841860 RepID=UPI00097D2432|nr:LuxR family transcriptional regulator [Mycobacterium rhizamassiliense]
MTVADDPLERATELGQLAALLNDVPSGRGQVCVIEGPSGIGKSRLLAGCMDLAAEREMQVLRVRCSELTRDHSFGVAHNLFGPALLRSDPAMRARLMQGPAALAEPVFGEIAAADEFAVVHGLYWLTVNLVEQRPLAVLVDDLPWADQSSQRFFAYLAERLDDLPVALVVTIRTGDPGSESALIGSVWDAATTAAIRPSTLSSEAVATLLQRALPEQPVDGDLVASVVDLTGGNPFFVGAVTDAMRAGEDPTSTTPGSVRRQITRRLARSGPSATALAKAGSVIGDDVSLADVSRLSGLTIDRGAVLAEQLVAANILLRADPMMFAHSIIRDATYSLLPAEERLTLHADAARILAEGGAESEVVAEHLLLAAAGEDKWVMQALRDAGRAAARKGVHSAALRYLRHALRVAPVDRIPPRLLVDLGLSEAAAGEVISLHRFEQALGLMDDPAERADALYSLGETLYRFGRFAEAGATFRHGAEFFDDGQGDIRMRFEGAAWSAEAHLGPTQSVPAEAIGGDGPHHRMVLAVQALRDSLSTPPADRTVLLALRALSSGALLADQGAQGPSVDMATLALLHCERLVQANEVADATVQDALDRGAELAYAEASLIRGHILYARGRIAEAAADAQAALERLELREHVYAHSARAIVVQCMIERGELDEAEELLDYSTTQLTETPAIKAHLLVARARLRLVRGEIDAAVTDLNELRGSLHSELDQNPSILRWRSLAGIVAHRLGDDQACQRLFDEEIGLARAFGLPISIGVAVRRRASTESGERALGSLREAVEILRSTEAPLQLARAHAALGRRLRRQGQQVEARKHLKVALDLAYRCGATLLERYTREELAASGARPRRPVMTGVESLTPTEARIAGLTAEGLSNRDVAEQLFVSSNTIAWHLRNIFRKLDIDSRDQLDGHLGSIHRL